MSLVTLARFSRQLVAGAVAADLPGIFASSSLNPAFARGASVPPGQALTVTLESAPASIAVTMFFGSTFGTAGDTLTLAPGVATLTTPPYATAFPQGGASYASPPPITTDATVRRNTAALALAFAAAGRTDVLAMLATTPPAPPALPAVIFALDLFVGVAAQTVRASGAYSFRVEVAQ